MPYFPEKSNFLTVVRYEYIALKGSTPFSVAAGGFPVVTITHNLGYVPYLKLFYTFGDGKYFQLYSGNASFNNDGNSFQIDDIEVSSTDIKISLENDSAGTITGTIYYRIYAEPQV